jgi:hypothetical protein
MVYISVLIVFLFPWLILSAPPAVAVVGVELLVPSPALAFVLGRKRKMTPIFWQIVATIFQTTPRVEMKNSWTFPTRSAV